MLISISICVGKISNTEAITNPNDHGCRLVRAHCKSGYKGLNYTTWAFQHIKNQTITFSSSFMVLYHWFWEEFHLDPFIFCTYCKRNVVQMENVKCFSSASWWWAFKFLTRLILSGVALNCNGINCQICHFIINQLIVPSHQLC